MPFHELIRVQCDNCVDCLVVPQTSAPNGTLFRSHSQAIRAADRQNWYVDSQVVHCASCREFALEWFALEQGQQGHTCCVCGERIPWHYAVINCGAMGVACLSHEAELRQWGRSSGEEK